jgi:hypothetical protein
MLADALSAELRVVPRTPEARRKMGMPTPPTTDLIELNVGAYR